MGTSWDILEKRKNLGLVLYIVEKWRSDLLIIVIISVTRAK